MQILNFCKGYKIYEPERLNEEYEVTDDVSLMTDVGVEKIKEVFQHFIVMLDEPLFFILELSVSCDRKNPVANDGLNKLASRKFELPELKLLIDAVESSKFIIKKKSKVINFRVDRIASKPEMLDKDIIPISDDFDMENYTKEVFFMFSGEKVLVDLRCDNSLMKTVVDRFKEDVTTLAYDMISFRVQTKYQPVLSFSVGCLVSMARYRYLHRRL